MPDRRANRGAHPQDATCFAPDALPALRTATTDLSWLLSRQYPANASLKLVGDRYSLRARQRSAVQRCAVADEARRQRLAQRIQPDAVVDRVVGIDGYNVLLTVEAALSGAVILRGRDGCYRDLAAMSSHYRRVRQTRPALTRIGEWLAQHGAASAAWYLDRPVSNSGRLGRWIEETAARHGWSWSVHLVANPDAALIATEAIVATADGGILDRAIAPRLNLARHVVEELDDVWLVDLARDPSATGDPANGRSAASGAFD